MSRLRWAIVLGLGLALAAAAPAAHPALGTASGVVKKATANVLLVSPRSPDGRFKETLVLKVTGTTRVFMLTTEMRGGQLVAVQRATDPRPLQPNQGIAVIYTVVDNETVLLTAVVQPSPAR
jgi:hypothetical protein